MGRDLAEGMPRCRALFEEADGILGRDLSRLCFEGPLGDLTFSSNAQPGLFVASLSCYEALRQRRPDVSFRAMAGLSSGEWTALHIADAIGFGDTLRVLDARGRFMQACCEEHPGAMLSVIGLPPERLAPICQATGVEMANFNAPEQTVLSGASDAIKAAEHQAREAGARRAIRLRVAGAFHSPRMADAAGKMAEFLQDIPLRQPSLPVLSNVTGRYHSDPESIRRLMVEQIISPVRWCQGIRWLAEQGIHRYVECGPGRVLTGLAKRIDKEAVTYNIHDLASLEAVTAAL
jgi:[acyl-carrier-protein] S-malonyltransferase